jgi:aryl-alcohol dehydrogenase-like predicted oxidoreductase
MRYADVPTSRRISKIGLGTWQFGSREWGYGPEYERRTRAIVERALECGITLFDTAEIYALGRSERLLGAALREATSEATSEARRGAFVATKIFPVLPVSPVVEQRAVASAARLGVRTIDLYQVHQPNPVIRDGTTMAGMRRLQAVGLIEHVGVSNTRSGGGGTPSAPWVHRCSPTRWSTASPASRRSRTCCRTPPPSAG